MYFRESGLRCQAGVSWSSISELGREVVVPREEYIWQLMFHGLLLANCSVRCEIQRILS